MDLRILGVVAEYDPFHRGHAYHLSEARRLLSPDAVFVALSPCFTQRGAPALLSPHDRAACALAAGADAVFALPVTWAVRDAENYALGAVSLLAGLGATHLAFGAEEPDLSRLRAAADLLDDPPEGFTRALKAALSAGAGYPAALSQAAESALPGAGALLSAPNNTLAVCYLRAIRRLKAALEPVVVPRLGAYRAEAVDAAFPSASAVRSALRRGDWAGAMPALPPASASRVRAAGLAGTLPDPAAWDLLLLSRLREMPKEAFPALPDAGEGLGNALESLRFTVLSGEELRRRLTSRRYSAARVSRLLAHALLGLTGEGLRSLPPPTDTLLLGLRRNPALTAAWKDRPLRVHPTGAAWAPFADPADLLAWRLWALICHRPATLPFTEKTVSV